MYGEVRNPGGRTAPGQLNRMRVDDLARVRRRKIPWIPVARLLEDDTLVRNAATHEGLLAYAESWLLIDYLMKDRPSLPVFRAYLDAIRDRRRDEGRLEVARAHLGDLGLLNEAIWRHSIQLLKTRV